MSQSHQLFMRAHPRQEDFDTTVNTVFALLQALSDFGAELSPKYMMTANDPNIRTFDWRSSTVAGILQEGVNRNLGDAQTGHGYSVTFFNSLQAEPNAELRVLCGVTAEPFINSVSLQFPSKFSLVGKPELQKQVIGLFVKLTSIFRPYWACVSNESNMERYSSYWENDLPSAVHWLNYLDGELSERVGGKRISECALVNTSRMGSGYLVVLGSGPIDAANADHFHYQTRATDELFRATGREKKNMFDFFSNMFKSN